MSDHYILEGRKAIPCDLMTWGRWFENPENRLVSGDDVNGARVSTVFLGIDHAFGYGPPMLFETMILGGPHDGYQERCGTWEQAEEMHKRALEAFYLEAYARGVSDGLPIETSAAPKRAYYETHDPPHCPTCDCGQSTPEKSMSATEVKDHGISVNVGDDGAWVTFKTKSGKHFTFQPAQEFCVAGSIGLPVIKDWCAEMQAQRTAEKAGESHE